MPLASAPARRLGPEWIPVISVFAATCAGRRHQPAHSRLRIARAAIGDLHHRDLPHRRLLRPGPGHPHRRHRPFGRRRHGHRRHDDRDAHPRQRRDAGLCASDGARGLRARRRLQRHRRGGRQAAAVHHDARARHDGLRHRPRADRRQRPAARRPGIAELHARQLARHPPADHIHRALRVRRVRPAEPHGRRPEALRHRQQSRRRPGHRIADRAPDDPRLRRQRLLRGACRLSCLPAIPPAPRSTWATPCSCRRSRPSSSGVHA